MDPRGALAAPWNGCVRACVCAGGARDRGDTWRRLECAWSGREGEGDVALETSCVARLLFHVSLLLLLRHAARSFSLHLLVTASSQLTARPAPRESGRRLATASFILPSQLFRSCLTLVIFFPSTFVCLSLAGRTRGPCAAVFIGFFEAAARGRGLQWW